jgi:hypothetical protein
LWVFFTQLHFFFPFFLWRLEERESLWFQNGRYGLLKICAQGVPVQLGGGEGEGVCFLGISFFLLASVHSRMDSIYWAHLVLVLCFGVFVNSFCQGESDANFTAVYIVSLRQAPSAHYNGELTRDTTGFKHASPGRLNIHKPR